MISRRDAVKVLSYVQTTMVSRIIRHSAGPNCLHMMATYFWINRIIRAFRDVSERKHRPNDLLSYCQATEHYSEHNTRDHGGVYRIVGADTPWP